MPDITNYHFSISFDLVKHCSSIYSPENYGKGHRPLHIFLNLYKRSNLKEVIKIDEFLFLNFIIN